MFERSDWMGVVVRNRRCLFIALVIVVATTAFAGPVGGAAGPRIVGGKPIKSGEVRELAAIMVQIPGLSPEERFACSATVLDTTHVLTAGHCADLITFVDGEFILGIEVQVASRDLGDPKAQTVPVKSVTVNKSFWNGNISQDLSIYTLAKPVLWYTAHLAGGGDKALTKAGSKVTIAGWGLREKVGIFEFPTGTIPTRANAAVVPVVGDRECKKLYDDDIQKGFVVPRTDICAGEVGRDACFGDSGGPMLAKDAHGNQVQVGVTSRGAGCATHYPGVYTDVAATRKWIDKNLATPCNVLAEPGFSDNFFVC